MSNSAGDDLLMDLIGRNSELIGALDAVLLQRCRRQDELLRFVLPGLVVLRDMLRRQGLPQGIAKAEEMISAVRAEVLGEVPHNPVVAITAGQPPMGD